ncbi:Glutamyl-tRNA(Gln) amidotransferase subunit A [Paraglaciecola mesophila]|uniref:Glutamyl-tRNA(Gln) amidotransferase subunit A n=1 Tax=Paraglaciecola mesophila TaxID=197222 RepID=A0A857JMY8_9ALTE|nr:amidase [Paraglaciecola mesophila]QHJ13243.1 Glutamyl-tRNA(Gln) amidotransferase subunit A [Paraglaciecola mesophila]
MLRCKTINNTFTSGIVIALIAASSFATRASEAISKQLHELTLNETQTLLRENTITVAQLSNYYLQRIEKFNDNGPKLNAVVTLNQQLAEQVAALDKKLKSDAPLGKLFGAIVLLKDNIDASGMPNTAGSWLMREHVPDKDAFLVKQLTAQDAIILGKTNLSEWANFRSTMSSSGWSSLHGQTLNPHDPTRSPCGSSSGSGVAVAADLTLLAVGTETDGSITCPAAVNGIVGIKPTLGLVSRSGIIPIAHSQDTAGPMTRSVSDAVIMLEAMMGLDPKDAASFAPLSLSEHLKIDGLKGKRIGVVRNMMGYHPQLDDIFENQLSVLKKAGAIVVDNANIENKGEWNEDEYSILLAEFKTDLNHYLTNSNAPIKSLQEAIDKNIQAEERTMPIFGQEIFISAQQAPELTEQSYLDALKNAKQKAGKEGIDATLAKYKVDLLIAPTTAPAWKIDHIDGDHFLGSASGAAAVAGYPHITVPMGAVSGMPVNMSFFGKAKSEGVLIEAAYGFEQATQARIRPLLHSSQLE